LICENIGKKLQIPVETKIMKKTQFTSPQAHLKLKERKLRTSLGFTCTKPDQIKGKIIGLVDDVATTRTTLKLAGKILKNAGAKEVWGVVFAHRF
jgi:competence protein ComFC